MRMSATSRQLASPHKPPNDFPFIGGTHHFKTELLPPSVAGLTFVAWQQSIGCASVADDNAVLIPADPYVAEMGRK